MKRTALAALLLTMFGVTACGPSPRIESAGLDPAVLDDCPRSVQSPGALPPRHPFQLEDGRIVIPIEEANARENMLTAGALVLRGAWVQCRSVVLYAEGREAALAE